MGLGLGVEGTLDEQRVLLGGVRRLRAAVDLLRVRAMARVRVRVKVRVRVRVRVKVRVRVRVRVGVRVRRWGCRPG